MHARQFEQFLYRLTSLTSSQRERLLALLQSAWLPLPAASRPSSTASACGPARSAARPYQGCSVRQKSSSSFSPSGHGP